MLLLDINFSDKYNSCFPSLPPGDEGFDIYRIKSDLLCHRRWKKLGSRDGPEADAPSRSPTWAIAGV